jgi:predicted AAA+ superfamily ATPase
VRWQFPSNFVVGAWKAVGRDISFRIEADVLSLTVLGVLGRRLEVEALQTRVTMVLSPVTDQVECYGLCGDSLPNANMFSFGHTICKHDCMWLRPFWSDRLERLWKSRSVIWFPGVRRAGKTTICRALKDVEYFDCELPRQRREMDDPEGFLKSLEGKRVVLDEVHRLRNPSELLKIAADHYPAVRVIATGSSTLGATRKLRDSLTGRKAELWLTPAMSRDLESLHVKKLEHRLYRGGLPPFLLADQTTESDFQEWMDSYWAKDIQELFRLDRRRSFLTFVELLLTSSGGIFEATRFARPTEVSRTTIANYLSVLETTFVAHVVRPYSTGKIAEIVAAPKVYGFDTGFVCYFRGWHAAPRRHGPTMGALRPQRTPCAPADPTHPLLAR